ncbi:hypothetical protein HELRODRAFT_160819 [Helobdella robusta]|uniref:Uncharacterized protein n=1 Tax=Helobdella robusta TaxID=6412 RepID=T1EQR9_HELRO|nr:hypothetical protein HELRODRAFT_160819 [Helobdella robusta]ESO06629.1 hypothetical protein HELRODRAFT_160819 [Helobdella robusta]
MKVYQIIILLLTDVIDSRIEQVWHFAMINQKLTAKLFPCLDEWKVKYTPDNNKIVGKDLMVFWQPRSLMLTCMSDDNIMDVFFIVMVDTFLTLKTEDVVLYPGREVDVRCSVSIYYREDIAGKLKLSLVLFDNDGKLRYNLKYFQIENFRTDPTIVTLNTKFKVELEHDGNSFVCFMIFDKIPKNVLLKKGDFMKKSLIVIQDTVNKDQAFKSDYIWLWIFMVVLGMTILVALLALATIRRQNRETKTIETLVNERNSKKKTKAMIMDLDSNNEIRSEEMKRKRELLANLKSGSIPQQGKSKKHKISGNKKSSKTIPKQVRVHMLYNKIKSELEQNETLTDDQIRMLKILAYRETIKSVIDDVHSSTSVKYGTNEWRWMRADSIGSGRTYYDAIGVPQTGFQPSIGPESKSSTPTKPPSKATSSYAPRSPETEKDEEKVQKKKNIKKENFKKESKPPDSKTISRPNVPNDGPSVPKDGPNSPTPETMDREKCYYVDKYRFVVKSKEVKLKPEEWRKALESCFENRLSVCGSASDS